MKTNELALLQKISVLFQQHRARIRNRWMELIKENIYFSDDLEYQHIYSGISTILENFICYIGDTKGADIIGYQEANSAVGVNFAYNDIPYATILEAYHYYKDAYLDSLESAFTTTDLMAGIRLLDRLHHETITVILDQYFQVSDDTAFSMAQLVEMRDYETGLHLERTRDLSVLISREMGLEESFIEQLYKVGPLHDLGKIAISDSILLKPGKLTKEEFAIIKQHTVIGGEAIANIIGSRQVSRGFLLMAIEVALYHHERYDGHGYPDNLKGEDIPLAARIFCVADSYDAITNNRPYQLARSHDEAVDQITKGSSKQFDPVVVQAFLRIEKRIAQ